MVGFVLALLLVSGMPRDDPALHVVPPLTLAAQEDVAESPGPPALGPAAPARPGSAPDPRRRNFVNQGAAAGFGIVGADAAVVLLGGLACLMLALPSSSASAHAAASSDERTQLVAGCVAVALVALAVVPPVVGTAMSIRAGAPADRSGRAWMYGALARLAISGLLVYAATRGDVASLDAETMKSLLPLALATELVAVPAVIVATLHSAPSLAVEAPAAAFARPVCDPAVAWR